MSSVAASGNSLQMYDTSCSYQTALELKRMSSGGGMTGVSGPMTPSTVGKYQPLSLSLTIVNPGLSFRNT